MAMTFLLPGMRKSNDECSAMYKGYFFGEQAPLGEGGMRWIYLSQRRQSQWKVCPERYAGMGCQDEDYGISDLFNSCC
jgi:hypothetical protein